jgi:2-polyprenyl-3-methyl-5-hydroxy-6-metoxy-1,4-benzoquinol methylase
MNVQSETDARFEFGKNWSAFLSIVGETQITEAERSLKEMLEVESLRGKTFLDIGCGSGLFSLAAARLGAEKIHSFDYDLQSVNCTREMKRRFLPDAAHWTIESGSVLDGEYAKSLGIYDIVYSWGVLHHTGNMRLALENAAIPVKPGGLLFIAIYNDQGRVSRFWHWVKKTYNTLPSFLRFTITIPILLRFWGFKIARDFWRGKPFESWRSYKQRRGMSAWHDVVDWAGGYPFEVAKPEQIFDFYRTQGFRLRRLKTVGGQSGCNEFVFGKENGG